MSIHDWTREMSSATDADLVEWENALDILEHWPAFNKQFGGMGVFALKALVSTEITRRDHQAQLSAVACRIMDAVRRPN